MEVNNHSYNIAPRVSQSYESELTDLSVVADQQVLRLDVTVDDVLRVTVAKGVCYLLHILGGTPLTAEQKMEEASCARIGKVRASTEEACLTQDANSKTSGKESSIHCLQTSSALCLFMIHSIPEPQTP